MASRTGIPGLPQVDFSTLSTKVCFPDGPQSHFIFYDFLNDREPDDWTFTAIGSGPATTLVCSKEEGGACVFGANHAADDDEGGVYELNEFFRFRPNSTYYFAFRGKFSNATEGDWRFGMNITAVTLTNPTDGVWFEKDDDDTNIDCHMVKDGATGLVSHTAAATADTSYHKFQIVVQTGASVSDNVITWAIDDTVIAQTTDSSELVDDEDMTLSLMCHNGTTAAFTFTVDWVLFAGPRYNT